MERRALERWNQGDPDGFLELTSGDVVYFDPALGRKIIGKKALGEYYGTVRGKVRIDTYRMIDPVVRLSPGAAVLAYDYEALRDGQVFRMHCTEVYTAATSGGWERSYIRTGLSPGRTIEAVRRAGYSPCGGLECKLHGTGHGKKNR